MDAKTEPVEFNSEISLGVESLPSTSSSSQDLLSVDSKTKVYLKPPMSPELMIAIAVRNLDPQKVAGASCSDIVAFLCLHFPYFSDNYQECKVGLIIITIIIIIITIIYHYYYSSSCRTW